MAKTELTGLVPGKSYAVQVRALGANGEYSDWSETITFTAPEDTSNPLINLYKTSIGDPNNPSTTKGILKSANFNGTIGTNGNIVPTFEGTTGWGIDYAGYGVFNNVFVRGNIQATTGTIGGFTIGADTLTATGFVLNTTGRYLSLFDTVTPTTKIINLDAYNGIWAGNSTLVNAPFRVDLQGNLLATSATITGSIKATSGYIGGSTSGWTINSGYIQSSGGTAKITLDAINAKLYVGTGTYGNSNTPFYVDGASQFSLGDKLTFTGGNLSISGAITATSGTFTGTVNATAGNFTNTVTIGSNATKISIAGTSSTTTTAIYSGSTTFESGGFWMDASGRFSLGTIGTAGLSWNTTALTVKGAINATSGSFTGTVNILSGGSLVAGTTADGVTVDSTGLYGYEQGSQIFSIPTSSSLTPTIATFKVVDTTIYSDGLDANLIVGTRGYAGIISGGTVGTVVVDGSYTTATITGMTNATNLMVGQTITATSGTGTIPAGTIVKKVNSATSISVASINTLIAGTVTNITGTGGYNIQIRGQDSGGAIPATPAAIFNTVNGVTTTYAAGSGFYLDRMGYFRVGTTTSYAKFDPTGSGTFTVSGTIVASAGDFAGAITVNNGTMKVGKAVNSTNDGIYIGASGDYLYSTGAFRFGGANGISYTGSGNVLIGTGVTVNGDISAATGTITGQTFRTSATATTNGVFFDSAGLRGYNTSVKKFDLTSSGILTASDVILTGTINATGGTFTGTVYVGNNATSSNNIQLIGTATNTTTAIGIGTGTLAYNTVATKFWADASGRFSLGQGLLWDGSSLSVNGGGTFTGALSGGTISIGSANNIFKADSNGIYLGNATFASAPFRVTPAGALTSTSGAIGGFTIGSNLLSASTSNSTIYGTNQSSINLDSSIGISKNINFSSATSTTFNGKATLGVDDGTYVKSFDDGTSFTATISIASPGVFTKTAHGFTGGEIIKLSTNGSLPSGLSSGTTYWVNYVNSSTFTLSKYYGGTAITTYGTQSGTHTVIKQISYSAPGSPYLYLLDSVNSGSLMIYVDSFPYIPFGGGAAYFKGPVIKLSSTDNPTTDSLRLNYTEISASRIDTPYINALGATFGNLYVTGSSGTLRSSGGIALTPDNGSVSFNPSSGSTNANSTFTVNVTDSNAFLVQSTSGVNLINGSTSTTKYVQIAGSTRTTEELSVLGKIYASSTIVQNSSRKYKKNIEIFNVPESLLEISPVTFIYDETKTQVADTDINVRHFGAIAEDFVDRGISEVIAFSPDGSIDGIEYNKIAVLLIPLIKQQKDRIEDLESRIALLENK
jgi:hypothetical protein